MDKSEAQAVLRLSAQPEWEVLSRLLAERLQHYQDQLMWLTNPVEIHRMQGQCTELLMWQKLRDDAERLLNEA